MLKLLSYNIQVGIDSHQFSHYLTRSWRHLLPNRQRQQNLEGVSAILHDFDIVALQEVDAGSLRSGFINQIDYLGQTGQFSDWYHQCNRNLGKIAQQSNGLLSRFPIRSIINHKLPGRIPGRGAIEAVIGENDAEIAVFVVHLSLGKRARTKQLEFLAKEAKKHDHMVIMGDMNCTTDELKQWSNNAGLVLAGHDEDLTTYPSWQPETHIDHVLVSQSLTVLETKVLPFRYSDHLPLAVTISLPDSFNNDFFKNYQPFPTPAGLKNHG